MLTFPISVKKETDLESGIYCGNFLAVPISHIKLRNILLAVRKFFAGF